MSTQDRWAVGPLTALLLLFAMTACKPSPEPQPSPENPPELPPPKTPADFG